VKKIIAFCGLAGSGKDTACNYLVDRGYQKMSFAAPLKQMAKIAFGFSDEQLYGPSSKREEQDTRYPFSGVCVGCGATCIDYTKKPPHENDLPEGYWYRCERCDAKYQRYVSARLALQTLGTEWGRRLSPDIWAKAAINAINAAEHDRWCISDLRFVNEFDAVKDAGGIVVRLMRGSVQHTHPSETELLTIPEEKFDWVVYNTGELADLYRVLDRVIRRVG